MFKTGILFLKHPVCKKTANLNICVFSSTTTSFGSKLFSVRDYDVAESSFNSSNYEFSPKQSDVWGEKKDQKAWD